MADSLPNGVDPYYEYDKPFYEFKSKVADFKKDDNTVMSKSDFIEVGKNYTGSIKEKVNLEDEFTVTYSSGSTKIGIQRLLFTLIVVM